MKISRKQTADSRRTRSKNPHAWSNPKNRTDCADAIRKPGNNSAREDAQSEDQAIGAMYRSEVALQFAHSHLPSNGPKQRARQSVVSHFRARISDRLPRTRPTQSPIPLQGLLEGLNRLTEPATCFHLQISSCHLERRAQICTGTCGCVRVHVL